MRSPKPRPVTKNVAQGRRRILPDAHTAAAIRLRHFERRAWRGQKFVRFGERYGRPPGAVLSAISGPQIVAAVDHEILAGNERARLAGKEDRAAGDLVGIANALQRAPAVDFFNVSDRPTTPLRSRS